MNPQRFSGPSARVVLNDVRRALGEDAIILSNRSAGGQTEIVAVSAGAFDALTQAPVASAPAAPRSAPAADPAPTSTLHAILRRGEKLPGAAAKAVAVAPATPVAAPVAAPLSAESGLLAEIQSMKGLLAEQLSSIALSESMRRSPLRSRLLSTLLGGGFSPALARRIVNHLPDDFSGEAAQRWLVDTLARNIPVAKGADLTDKGGVYAVVGPTGVGKTTTIAKLAARCVMKHGAAGLGLITTDDYRVGAQDQLRVYARLLGVPVYVAQNAQDLKQALDAMAGKRLVLIDTIGMSQRDERVKAQHDLLIGAGVQRLLAINATAQAETLDEVAQAYTTHNGKPAPLAGAIITKSDETARLGCALDVVMRRKLALHFVTNGQRVPEDIVTANAAVLARYALKGGVAGKTHAVFSMDDDETGLMLATASSQTLEAR